MQPIYDYLQWLHGSKPFNLCFKLDGIKGGIVSLDGISDKLADLESNSNLESVYVSAHLLKDGIDPVTVNQKITISDIAAFRFLLIDLDPVPHDRCSTDNQHTTIMAYAGEITEDLTARGLLKPLIVDSGNGALLLFPIDLPHTADNRELMGQLAGALKAKYETADCEIDTAVTKDPSRIIGVAGTVNRSKREIPSEQRRHRMRAVVGEYPPREPMTEADFKAVADRFIVEHEVKPAMDFAEKTASEKTASEKTATNKVERCRAYLSKCPDANSGDGGHDKTLRAACETQRFGLTDAQATGSSCLARCLGNTEQRRGTQGRIC